MSKRSKGFQQAIQSGIPFLLLILGGTYGISEFLQTGFEYRDRDMNRTNVRKFDLNEEHKKMMEKLKINDYKLSRIPRKDDNIKK